MKRHSTKWCQQNCELLLHVQTWESASLSLQRSSLGRWTLLVLKRRDQGRKLPVSKRHFAGCNFSHVIFRLWKVVSSRKISSSKVRPISLLTTTHLIHQSLKSRQSCWQTERHLLAVSFSDRESWFQFWHHHLARSGTSRKQDSRKVLKHFAPDRALNYYLGIRYASCTMTCFSSLSIIHVETFGAVLLWWYKNNLGRPCTTWWFDDWASSK